jgi:uncharacterized protein with FMN-binding domain
MDKKAIKKKIGKTTVFTIRLVNLAVIVGGIVIFNNISARRTAAEEKSARKYEEESLRVAELAEEETEALYEDGTYQGQAKGYGGQIVMEVDIKNGKIAEIRNIEAEKEDSAYFQPALALTERIIKKQSTDIDTVSGATFSSKGILGAVDEALRKAEKK